MKKAAVSVLIILFMMASCATLSGLTGGVKTKSVKTAKIEDVQFKPDKKGNYYVYVTVRNLSGVDRPFYMMIKAEDQPPQLTASGKKGQPKPIPDGKTYTFKLNTLLKHKPKKIKIEIMDHIPR